MSADPLSEEELASLKGIADEPTWDDFVKHIGGVRISDEHPNADFPNADYLFQEDKVIIELKILETEFGNTEQFRNKAKAYTAKFVAKEGKSPMALDPKVTARYFKGFIDLFRNPIARIAKKANKQIRETKKELDLPDHLGVWLLVNDNFRELPPRPILGTLGRILNGAYRSVDAVIYLTNHYVLMPGDDYGRILWTPLYSPNAPQRLVDFVNELGRKWFDYTTAAGLPADDRQAGDDLSIAGARAAGSKFPIA